ncbi:nucleotide/sugar transporter family protein [Wolffia australiana]
MAQMEESNEDSVKVLEQEGKSSNSDESLRAAESSPYRALSFSSWCNNDEIGAPAPSPDGASPDDVPFLQQGGSSRDTRQDGKMSSSNYLPLDVEQGARSTNGEFEDGINHQSVLSLKVVLKTLFLILLWYTSSTCLTLYNKSLLGNKLGNFPAPLLMNTIHFVMQAVLSRLILWCRPRNADNKAKITWHDYFFKVVPTALGTALDINLSNTSLVFISVTFATMCKSASPIFLLLFAFAFRLESPSFKLLGIILIISLGVLLAVSKETEFEFWGFILVLFSSVMSGFRWSMTQILLQKETYGLKNPLMLMSYVTPVMSVATLVFSLILDPWSEFKNSGYFDSSEHIVRSCLLMFLGGALAFGMVLTEYILVSVTSAVTVTIAGVVKEAVTIMAAVFYFHDKFTWLKGVGLLTIMIGVSLFNVYKYQKLKQESSSTTSTESTKYVILDEMDSLEDSPPTK